MCLHAFVKALFPVILFVFVFSRGQGRGRESYGIRRGRNVGSENEDTK